MENVAEEALCHYTSYKVTMRSGAVYTNNAAADPKDLDGSTRGESAILHALSKAIMGGGHVTVEVDGNTHELEIGYK